MKVSRDRLRRMSHQELIEFADSVGLATHGDATEVLARIITSSREFTNF